MKIWIGIPAASKRRGSKSPAFARTAKAYRRLVRLIVIPTIWKSRQCEPYTIITLYDDKFNKIASINDASKTFHEIPAQLTNDASRYPRWCTTDGHRNSELAEISEIKESMGGSMSYRTHT